MNKLLAFGDSFTWGTDLKDADDSTYSQTSWSALLAKNISLEYACYAVPGSSNQSISRDLLSALTDINKDDVVLLNWSWISRWDFYNLEDTRWETIRPTGTDTSKFSKLYFKYIQSELWDKWESLKTIALTHSILEKHKIKFIATCVDNLLIDQIYHTPGYVTALQKEIYGSILWFEDKGFFQWSKDNNFPISTDGGHPLEEAHQAAFKYIKENYEFTK